MESRSLEAVFAGPLTITLAGARAGTLRYTTDGGEPTAASPVSIGSIRLAGTTVVMARLFDAAGGLLGHPWVQPFRQDRPEPDG